MRKLSKVYFSPSPFFWPFFSSSWESCLHSCTTAVRQISGSHIDDLIGIETHFLNWVTLRLFCAGSFYMLLRNFLRQ